jgi:hypothetical protein
VLQVIVTEDTQSPFGIQEGLTRIIEMEPYSNKRIPVQRSLDGEAVLNILLFTTTDCTGTAWSSAGPGALVQARIGTSYTVGAYQCSATPGLAQTIRSVRPKTGGCSNGYAQVMYPYSLTQIGVFPLTLGPLTLTSP